MNTARSKQLLERARKVIPGGVNSPVRAFGSVGGQARFIRSASGARIEDARDARLRVIARDGREAVIPGRAPRQAGKPARRKFAPPPARG